MAVSRIQRLVDEAEAAFDTLCEVIERSDPAHWNEPEAAGDWSLRQLAAHVSANTRFHTELIHIFLGSTPPDADTSWTAERDAALDAGPAATVAWMRADHARHLPSLRLLTDDQLAVSGETRVGVVTVEYLLRRIASHARQHTRQARRICQTVEARAREGSVQAAPSRYGEGGTMEKDPVCGMDVDPNRAAATVVYERKTYYFCAPGCKKAFERAPEVYLKKGQPAR